MFTVITTSGLGLKLSPMFLTHHYCPLYLLSHRVEAMCSHMSPGLSMSKDNLSSVPNLKHVHGQVYSCA